MTSKPSPIRFRTAYHSDDTGQGYIIQMRVRKRFSIFESWQHLTVSNGFETVWRYATSSDAEEALIKAIRKMIYIESEQ